MKNSGGGVYRNIKRRLQELGYEEFKDFIPSSIFRKKIAMIWGNCHLEYIKKYISYHPDFCSEYGFYDLESIWEIKDEEIQGEVFKECDLLLYQPIRPENQFGPHFASGYIISLLKDSCRKISVPNLLGLPKCFFPQASSENLFIGKKFVGLKDDNIEIWRKQGLNALQVYEKIWSEKIYTNEYILNLFDEFISKTIEREKQWDIKILDYIIENYKSKKCFLDLTHPSQFVLEEIAKRTLKYMNYKIYPYEIEFYPYGYEVPIYPCVKNSLGMDFQENDLKSSHKASKINNIYMDLKEYVNQYFILYNTKEI